MGKRKKPVNHSAVPDEDIEKIARCIYPNILAYFESKEGQREFAEWKAKQNPEAAQKK